MTKGIAGICCTLFAFTLAALASFAPVAHADDGAPPGSSAALSKPRQSVDHLLVALGMPDLARSSHRRTR